MLRNIKITDIYWNLNLMFSCIAAHRTALFGVHFHNQETQPDTGTYREVWTVNNLKRIGMEE